MKITIIALVAALASVLPVSARIGETKQEVDQRYGKSEQTADRLAAAGVETWKYNRDNLVIEVVLVNGVSIWEIFQRTDKLISEEDIRALLKVYEAPGHSWRFDRSENLWKRSGKPKFTAFRWPGHEDYLSIQDADAREKAEKTAKINAKGL